MNYLGSGQRQDTDQGPFKIPKQGLRSDRPLKIKKYDPKLALFY